MIDKLIVQLVQLVQRARSTSPNDRIVTADEVALWPETALESLLRYGVLAGVQPATTVECDACLEGHAEVVEFIEEPPGSEARAYISCPEFGRVRVDLQRMRRWEIMVNDLETSITQSGHAVPGSSSEGAHPRFRHSPDFRSVNLDGREHSLTGRQAQVIEFLWEIYQNGTPEVSQGLILEHLESTYTDLRNVFKGNPAWGGLVISGRTKGTYRLNL